MRVLSEVIGAFAVVIASSQSHADIILTFANNDTFEGDDAGDTAGPFTDQATGVTGTITTQAVSPSGVLNPNMNSLGIDSDGDTGDFAARFDNGESWTFEWDVKTFFAGIDFDLFSEESETFSVQSNDWTNLMGVNPGSDKVTYNSSTGTFEFLSGTTSDDFDLEDISGGTVLPVNLGTDIVVSYSGDAADDAVIADMTFATPEPSSFVLAGLTALAFAGFSVLRCQCKKRSGNLMTSGANAS